VGSAKHFCQEVLLPIIGHELEHCYVKIAENRNTAAFSLLPQMKRFTLEQAILTNTPGAFAPFCSLPIIY
jgi:hypothetical protein